MLSVLANAVRASFAGRILQLDAMGMCIGSKVAVAASNLFVLVSEAGRMVTRFLLQPIHRNTVLHTPFHFCSHALRPWSLVHLAD